MIKCTSFILALCLGLTTAASACVQQPSADNNAAIPHLIRFGGVLKYIDGKPAQGTVRVTFAFYKEEQGGEPLWTETQGVTFDASGHYSVMLGATMSEGLPQALFQAGDAWWIETRVTGAEDDQGARTFASASSQRSLLAAVPYALKSADAESLAGHSASDFVTQEQLARLAQSTTPASQAPKTASVAMPLAGGTIAGSGTAGTIPLWTGSTTQGNSEITQAGSNIGINTSTPATTLDVNGTATVRGALSVAPIASATAAAGQNSQHLNLTASAWSTATNSASPQTFDWVTATLGNNTPTPSGALYLQFQSGTAVRTNLFNISSNGVINFSPAQTFPGTIKSVTGTSPLKAATNSGAATLSLDTTALETTLNGTYAQLGANNLFTGVQLFGNSVGIGVQYPFYPLHVDGTIRSEEGGLSLGGYAPLLVDSFGTSGGRLAVLYNGNVGIDNPNPQSALDVGGNINASGSLTASGATLFGSSNVFGNASVSGSLSIGGDQAMSAAPHMYLTGYVAGPLGADTEVNPIVMIPSKNIVITRMTSNGINTCPNSGALTFSLYAGVNNIYQLLYQISLPGFNIQEVINVADSGPLSIGVTAGTPVFGFIDTPNCGSFGTAPGNIPVSIEYVMQ
jgi:hypothetical protein